MKIPAMALVLVAASVTMAAETSLLFENSDFEKGDLTNWTAEGDAFKFQPTKGDNPKARNREPSRHQGDFWIGTFEKYNGKVGRPGEVQTDVPRGELTSTEFKVTRDYINFLIGGGGYMGTCVKLLCEGKTYYVSSGFSSETMQRVSADVRRFKGKKARILILDGLGGGWGHINADDFTASDKPLGDLREPVIAGKDDPYPGVGYKQKYRPQFHFTSKRNWHNDVNGPVYYKGEYHLFFQHNPGGIGWGNMTWGHAVSKDLVHWKQVQHAIHPYDGGTIFSGSAAVDWNNTSGFGKKGEKAEKPIIACYTHARAPFTQAIAYSIDRGRTWTRYRGNPVVPNQGVHSDERDPKIFWHEPTKKWVMLLFLKVPIARFFISDDLKTWTGTSDVTGRHFAECPDIFELPVDGDKKNTKWVLHDGGFLYSIGSFDGRSFKIEATPGRGDLGGNFYAAQVFNDAPDGRVVQVAWMAGSDFAQMGMPFNQQVSFPCELTLRTTDDGIRIYRWPVKEIESLYKKKHKIEKARLKPGDNPLKDIKAELIDLYADITVGSARKIAFNLRGSPVSFHGNTLGTVRGRAPLKPQDGRITVRILIDRGSVEVFGNEGRLSLTTYALHEPENLNLSLTVEGGEAMLNKLVVNELKSAWK
ncbi:MAG: glycoside hydrolase family 32 protein [Planctomycetota bacterium]